MGSKTKKIGNKAESVILSEFIKNDIPVLIPFGDNEKYDLVADVDGKFYSVQVKHGQYKNGGISVDLRHRIGVKRIKYETYFGKVDLFGVWCEKLNTTYLLPIEMFGKQTSIVLRVEQPKRNSCISKIIWADNFQFAKIISRVREVVSRHAHNLEAGGASPSPATNGMIGTIETRS